MKATPTTEAGRKRQAVAENPRAWRVRDYCEHYGVGRTKAKELIRSGVLASVKIGSRRLILADSAEALLRGEAG